ncbi:MAG: sulfatase-like hydrolase/transferase [Akkermansiaceae bacterium]|nr:sulfatase-like hydrolase/transferase [Akkermansiaceae bacterium]
MHRPISQLLTAAILTTQAFSNPVTSAWFTEPSGQYARIYANYEDEAAGKTATTWIHPTGNSQTSPTYSGVSEISITSTDVYLRTSGLAFHIMGPWYGETGNLFVNYPGNIARTVRFPLSPTEKSIPKTLTPGGTIGYFVDGVAMFDSRDAFSFINSTGTDAGPSTGANRGDGIWNRDAFVNESLTFDPGNAHPAGNLLHYHANPPALRHLLDDSVTYDSVSNTYTEAPNGNHSPIIGFTFDGFPIYGPYGYSDPLDSSSAVRRMISGYQLRDGSNGSTNLATTGRTTLPTWVTRNQTARTNPLATNQYGPAVNSTAGGETFILGHYLEDYDYKGDRGLTLGTHFDLNEYNVRWCVTPEFPAGTWAYFTCIAANGTPVFPYNIGRYYFGTVLGDDNVTLPTDREILFEGGPEASPKITTSSIDSSNGNVTLTWSGAEGGTYRVDRSPDLAAWKLLNDSATPTNGNQGTGIDEKRATTEPKQFYRTSLNSIAPFDANGFDYTTPVHPTFTATFASLPTGITSVTVGGAAATIVGTEGNSLLLTFTENYIPAGNYNAIVTFSGGSVSSTNTHTVSAKRNILLLILDDWGIDSSPIDSAGTPGATFPPMPNLEALAARGLRFTNAYAQPICSPTRASIITGRYGFRNGVGHPSGPSDLPASELTLPEIFTAQVSGYSLASFGKWHLGGGDDGPATIGGWPEFRGILGGGVRNFYDWDKTVNGTTSPSTAYTTTDQVNDAVSFINSQGSTPWFVWMGFNAPHDPFHNPPSALHSYPAYATDTNGEVSAANRRNAYEAALQTLDSEIGRLLTSVDLNTTDIILIGDNGTPAQVVQAPYTVAHSKGSLYEGGIHVPLVIAGPSVEITGTSSRFVHCVDLFSTILELARIDVPSATSSVDTIDSQSLIPILKGQDGAERHIVSERYQIPSVSGDGRTIVLAEFPDYALIALGDPTSASDTTTYEMYNITTDSNQQTPLAIPPALTDAHCEAYLALIEKDQDLGPNNIPVTLYLEIPSNITANTTGPGSVPQNTSLAPDSITIDGTPATFVSRVTTSQVANRYWVRCTIPSAAASYSTATIDFPDNTANNVTYPRIFTTTAITVSP